MKFYKYPLALVAYALVAVFLLAYLWNWLGNEKLESYWYFFPACAGGFLLISFVLSKLNIQWEWDVAIQVAVVLIPVLYYVNIKEPYKPPVYIFIVNSGYTGELHVIFNLDKNAPTNANSTADTLYFNFDKDGDILLNEDVAYVKESMKKNLFYLHPDASKKHIPYVDKKDFPFDTTQIVLVADSTEAENGRMKVMHYRIDFPQHLK